MSRRRVFLAAMLPVLTCAAVAVRAADVPTVTIADAAVPAGREGQRPGDVLPPPPAPREAERTRVEISVSFTGRGRWSDPRSGAYSDLSYRRELSYTVPLSGGASAGAALGVVDRREQTGGPFIPDLQRYLVLQARDATTGGPCGKGLSRVHDRASGMEVGDPGQPPLVPFDSHIEGGGSFPSGDPSVPERDLCKVQVSIDREKRRYHLVVDGTDSHVKVANTYNGRKLPPYNLKLHGPDGDGSVKAKFVFLDLPLPVGNARVIEGSRTLHAVNRIDGPAQSSFPLTATVRWKIVME